MTQDKPETPRCGACFQGNVQIVEEIFPDNMSAFGRYGKLSRRGKTVALCQDSAGSHYYVCHIASSDQRDTD